MCTHTQTALSFIVIIDMKIVEKKFIKSKIKCFKLTLNELVVI